MMREAAIERGRDERDDTACVAAAPARPYRYKSLIELSPYPMWSYDIETLAFVDVNEAAISHYGWSREEFAAMTVLDVRPPEDRQRFLSREHKGQSAQVRQVWRHMKKDGTPIYVEITPMGVLPGERNLQTVLSVDVTDRVLAEEALHRKQEALQQAQQVANFGSWEWDLLKDSVEWSPQMYEIFGIAPEEGHEGFATVTEYIHIEDRDRLKEGVMSAIARAGSFQEEYRIIRPDGQLRYLDARGLCTATLDGAAAMMVGTLHDITSRIEAEQARLKLEGRLRQSQKMEAVGQLAGGVAHDFNNMLTVIIGFSQMTLQRLPEGSEERDALEEILKAGERAALITSQLLAFSRQQVLALQVLDLNQVVNDTERMLRRLIGEDIAVATSLDPQLSRVEVDAGQIVQVIMNLAVNARDAMPQGGKLTIKTQNLYIDEERARIMPDCPPGPYVLLSVSDSGAGMPPDVRVRIFEPFFTTKGPGEGTGLGLATVYGIIKQSGGNVEVYSEVGTGTTFKIHLPAVDRELVSLPTAAAESRGGSETILLVEDEAAVRKVALAALTEQGYHVLVAEGGHKALEMARHHTERIDLVLTDLVMPEMSGRQVADAVTQLLPGTKVLYMSGYTDDAVVRHGLISDSVAFLQKPFTATSLASKVRSVLDAPSALRVD